MIAFQVGAFQDDFQQSAGLAETPAGRRYPRRLFVEIDGEAFWVRNEEEARRLLLQARETAQALAEVSTAKARVSGQPVRAPKIRGSKALEAPIAEARKEIEEIFKRTAIDYELYQLLTERLRQEDDELEALLLL